MKDLLLYLLFIVFAALFVPYMWNVVKNTKRNDGHRILCSVAIFAVISKAVVLSYITVESIDRLEENAMFYHMVADDLEDSVAIKIVELGIKPNSIQRVALDPSLTYGTAELDIKGSAVTLEVYRLRSDWLIGCEESGGIFYDLKSYPKVLEKLLDTRECIDSV